MQHRFLLIGDRFWGEEYSTAELTADLALVDHPSLPLSFSIHSSPRNTLDHLFHNCSRDIIGRQAGVTLLCVGWEDLQSSHTEPVIQLKMQRLVHEIHHNSQTQILLCTLPTVQFQENSVAGRKAHFLNGCIRQLAIEERATLVDLEAAFLEYQTTQVARGDFMRNLFTDEGSLGNLGRMLAARLILNFLGFPKPFYYLPEHE